MKKIKFWEEKGITLIALVVTIIVLLILVGVSISTLVGDNGILIRAKDAKEQTGIAKVKEIVLIDILSTQVKNNGENITKEQYVEILDNYFEDTPTEEELEDLSTLTLKTKSEYGSYDIKISDIWNGTFRETETDTPVAPSFDESTFTLGTNPSDIKNTDKYGWKVTNYKVKTTNFTTGVWRLFYQDSNYTYLITDELVGSYLPISYCGSYTNGASVSVVGQKLSQRISSLFTTTNENNNIKAVS